MAETDKPFVAMLVMLFLVMASLSGIAVSLSLNRPEASTSPTFDSTDSPAPSPSPTADATAEPTKPLLVLVSIDGFRADYFTSYPDASPNLHALAGRGVRVKELVPSFPSKTFPNHYTIVTGLYPGDHGIISNNIYDPVFDSTFRLSDAHAQTEARWWGGEPIWTTAQKAGQTVGTYTWPGSEAPHDGLYAQFREAYRDRATELTGRVDTVLSWLDRPVEDRPTFVTLYFEGVDHAGHSWGPTDAVKPEIKRADAAVGYLMDGLAQRGLDADIIVLADHGMSQLSEERMIYLDDYIDTTVAGVLDWSPLCAMWPSTPDALEELYANLTKAPIAHLTVWKKKDVPESLHYSSNRRIPPLLALADDGYTISSHSRYPLSSFGTHGFDPASASSMSALFVAAGPAFASGREVERFPNTDVYNLMALVLGVAPAANNGTDALAAAVCSPGLCARLQGAE